MATTTYIGTSQAAAILGTTQAEVRRLIRRGELDGQKVGGWFILDRAQVEAKAAKAD